MIRLWLIALLLTLSACSDERVSPPSLSYGERSPVQTPVYSFAIHPLYSPGRLFEKFSPLIDYVNARLEGAKLVLQASQDYPAYDRKIRAQQPDFLLPNPFQTLIALRHGYHVFGKVADDSDFRGIILVRKDSGIRRVADLKGGVIAAPGPTALAATMMPKYFLASNGLDVKRDVTYTYTGTQESTIMALYLKRVSAATTWPIPWRLMQRNRPDVAAQLRVAWRTDTLPSNSLMAHERVPEAVLNQVRRILFSMSDDPRGRKILQASTFVRFVAASDATYAPVEAFIRAYSEKVEPVELK